jgi:NAD(P)-dependent dehydrogenase (short-subunit alcohol dehydrogenase family)
LKKVILITGISSGFGKAAAGILAKAGHTVYGTVRNSASQAGSVNTVKMDLTDLPSIAEAVKYVYEKEGRIDVLINNAGMHTGGPVETSPDEYIRLQMETNFYGMVILTRQVLPVMRSQGGGTIINFGSIGGLMGLPFQAFYSASKFAIEGFSEALRMEVNRFNIKVIVINPGDFSTGNSANRRQFLAPSSPGDPYHDQFHMTLEVIEKDEAGGWKPEVLAGRILKIVESKNPRQRYIIGSFEQKLAVVIKKILPGSLFRKILEDHYRIK